MPEQPKVSIEQSLLLQAIEQLSALDKQVGVLQGQINIVIAENERAADKRQAMYDKLNKIDTIEVQLNRIVPLVDKHERRHNQADGAMSLGKIVWTAAIGAFGAGLTMLFQWLTGWRPHP